MEAGAWWFLGLAGLLVGLVLVFGCVEAGRHEWRWIRWPFAIVLVALASVVVLTPSWPDGLGLQTCESVVNPALADDPTVTPTTIETCSDVGASSVPLLLLLLIATLALAPDLGEFAIPGLVTLKRRVEKQEKATDAQESRIELLATQIKVASTATSQSQVAVYMGQVARGQATAPAASVARIAEWAYLHLTGELRAALGDPDASVSIYTPVHAEGLLRRFGVSGPDVTDFKPGLGATGQAFKFQETIVVTGGAVNDGSYGLNEQQRVHWADTKIVGSTPVLDPENMSVVLGTLTCASTTSIPDGSDDAVRSHWDSVLEEYSQYAAAWIIAFAL